MAHLPERKKLKHPLNLLCIHFRLKPELSAFSLFFNTLFSSFGRMVNAFEEQIGSAVESAITKKLNEGILKLDSFLQALPKEIPVDDNASLNVTFVNDPLLSNSSIEFEINGLFTGRKRDPVPRYRHENSQTLVFCPDSSKMLGIALDEAVFNSASSLYYNVSLELLQSLCFCLIRLKDSCLYCRNV